METLKLGTLILRTKNEVNGFTPMFEKLVQKVILGGMSKATFINYGSCSENQFVFSNARYRAE